MSPGSRKRQRKSAAARSSASSGPWHVEEEVLRLRQGPCTAEDLAAWPLELASSLLSAGKTEDEEMALRLATWLHGKVIAYSDYSGVDCPRTGIHMALQGLNAKMAWHFTEDNFEFVRTADKGPLQTDVLCQLSRMHAERGKKQPCHFGDLLHRCPPVARDWIASAMPGPSPGATLLEREMAFTDIHAWIKANSAWIFKPGSQQYCHVHRKQCALHPIFSEVQTEKNGPAPVCMLAGPRVDDAGGKGPRPLYVNIAGMTCVGWSEEGAQAGFGDPSEAPHSVWQHERYEWARHNHEDLFIAECVPKYPVQRLRQELTGHQVLDLVINPASLGWPVRRPRRLMAGINLSKLCWCGPKDYAADFASRFHRMLQLSGDAFFLADDDTRMEEYAQLCMDRKFQVTSQAASSSDEGALLRMMFFTSEG